ncbi:4-hydroxy-tetrahydrodipicolinate synthase [Desulfovibrio sp. OttesenSCG-928-C06]|nr:4-hydroxy-tetrahydrodipicolinate synthase [Desulfovibrio sp. OttesenSCG-928-C06]
MQLAGAITALVTPFKNGSIDEEAYRQLIEWQIEEGIDGLVPCGTTGESATLSHEEHEKVISICIDQVKKRVPVIAGAGSNNTAEAINLLRFAKKAGADAGLMITPYYNKPTMEGVFQHFKAIAAEVTLPMVVYNVPGRTGSNVTAQCMARMVKEIPTVVAAKEASGNIVQISDYMELCGPKFSLLVGDDFVVLPAMAMGCKGVISVSSNIAPRLMHEQCQAFFDGDMAKARDIHYKMAPINRACFLETNPGPVKTALAIMGKIPNGEMRLPMVPISQENEKALRNILAESKLI